MRQQIKLISESLKSLMTDSASHQSTMDQLERALVTLKQDYHILKKDVADLVNVNEGRNQDVADLLTMSKGLQEEWREKEVASEGEDSSKESKNSSHEPRSSDEL